MTGDSSVSPTCRDVVVITHAPIDPPSLLEAVADVTAGGNVLFVGTVRSMTDGAATTSLGYDAHEPLTRAVLASLLADARERFSLVACGVAHRLGTVLAGEVSVAVAVSAPHRKAAFAAAEWLMEQIKRDVPIWKCEHRPDGSHEWVHGHATPGGAA
jgi:molybdopterin synthase catalytic subunit